MGLNWLCSPLQIPSQVVANSEILSSGSSTSLSLSLSLSLSPLSLSLCLSLSLLLFPILSTHHVEPPRYPRSVQRQRPGHRVSLDIHSIHPAPLISPKLSIVAVHGLNGGSVKTWTTEETGKFWLGESEMLPHMLKNARILTFGYNASVTSLFGRTCSDHILQHAQTLVAGLVADRHVSMLVSLFLTATEQQNRL